jgi:cytochrome c
MLQRFQTALVLSAATALIALAPNPAVAGASGKTLVTKSDCLGCHSIGANEPKKLGPNYFTVATKYAGDKKAADMLSNTIRKGGSGHWGSIPMPAHPSMSEDDAETIATWILSLKSAKAHKPAKPAKPAKS